MAQLVKELRYKPEGQGFDPRWFYPSGRTMVQRSTQPLTEMSTRNISRAVKAAGA
jgi:hypothetical protein